MKKNLLRFSYCLTLLLFSNYSIAQGTYGKTSYFNFTYSKVADWSSFTTTSTFTAVVDGDSLIFGGTNGTGPTRAKGGFTGAVRTTSIELPKFQSLGYLSFYIQNGSTGTTRDISIKVLDEKTSTWTTVETFSIGGNVDQRIISTAALSKKAVKVKIESAGAYFWFHQLEAWSNTLETSNVNEAPSILSFNPAPGSTVPANGSIIVQLDEIVKAGSGSITFAGAAITTSFSGSTLKINYTGLTGASNSLTLPGSFMQNLAGVAGIKDTTVTYANDIADPVYQSASPIDGSKIYTRDIVGKIVLTFNEEIALGTGTITFGPAAIATTVSGKTLIIGYSGLAYNTAYTLTIPSNMVKDISGNTYKNIITLNYTTYDKDNVAPLLSTQSLTNGQTNVPIGGSITLAFNEIVKQMSDVTLNGNPVKLSFNGVMVGVNYTNLDYTTEYTLSIPAGAITDTTGNAYAGTSFTFKTKAASNKAFDMIVAKDGSGDYTTIKAAINAVPDLSPSRTMIFVKNGLYTEKVLIPASKQNISLIGQDSAKTIIAFNDYAGMPGGSTDLSYTINIKAPGFYAENITIKNTWSLTGGSTNQAVALMTEGDKQVFKNCRAYSFQDTHYPKVAGTRNYYKNCFIEGATDFIFGAGTAYFDDCTINCVNGGQYITAPSGTTKEFGMVFNNNIISANKNVAAQAYFLGRPWKDQGKTMFLNTKMGPHIKDIGWAVWATAGDDADNHLTGFYGEYNSMNLTGTVINPTRAAWGVKLTAQQATRYDIDHVFNFGQGSDTWNPLPYITAPNAPTNVAGTSSIISWDASKYAVGYLVFRNDTLIANTNTNNYSVNVINGTYKVKAYNEFGAQSDAGQLITGIRQDVLNNNFNIYPNPFGASLHLTNIEKIAHIEFYDITGKIIKRSEPMLTIDTAELLPGYYIIKVRDLDGNVYYKRSIRF